MNKIKYQFSDYRDLHVVIDASAGTGKTYTIENMIPQFIEGGVPIDKIAVLTFTEKAAAELQDRIRRELSKKVLDPTISQDLKKNIQEALELLPNANIGTIHHFCRIIIKKHSLAIGLSASFSEIKKIREELDTYFKRFWGRIEKDDSDVLIRLLQIVDFPRFKNLLIQLAEKSGGKKIKLLEKEKTSSIESDLLILKSLLDNIDLTQEGPGYISKLRNFHSQNFLNKMNQLSGIKKTFLTASLEPNLNVRKFIVGRNSINDKEYDVLLERLRMQLEKEIAYEVLNPILEYANLLIEEFEKYLKSEDKISLDGLIIKARDLLLDKTIRKQIQNDIQYVILDECQDTNPIQIDLITTLFSGINKGIIFVGDPKQSIYRFRNADLISYSEAVNSLNPRKKIILDKSYRSSHKLIKAFNIIFPKLSSLREVYEPVEANRTLDSIAEKIAPPLLLLGLDQNHSPKMNDEEGNPFRAESLKKCAIDEIANLIHVITNNENYLIGEKNNPGKYRRIKYSDIAILSNSNSSLNLLLKEFSKKSISANIYKSPTFYSHKIVQAISHLLHAVENPNDSSSLYKALASDLFLISESVLYQLSQEGELSYLTDSKFSEINSIYDSLRKAHEKRYLKDVAYTLQEILHENKILEVISVGFEGKRNLANIYHLSEILNFTQISESLSFGEVVRKFKKDVENSVEQEIRLDNDKKDDSFNSVQLMTMHTSKGLEFPVCILFDLTTSVSDDSTLFIKDTFLREEFLDIELSLKLTNGNFIETANFQREYDRNVAELIKEKGRLLYVGFTRAMDYLVIPLHTTKKVSSNSLRGLLEEAFHSENITHLIQEGLAENFSTRNILQSKGTVSVKEESILEENREIKLTSIEKKDLQNKAGLKIRSYSSIARDSDNEEELVKEKIVIEKNTKSENEDTSSFTLSAEKRGTSFGLLCHYVMENVNLKLLAFEEQLKEEIIRLVNEYYPKTRLNDVTDYSSKHAIEFCFSALTKSYPMNESQTEFARVQDWKYLSREKSFFYKLSSNNKDFLIGIGDGIFYWKEKFYILDWKTNLIKVSDTESIEQVIARKVKESYYYQYMIYCMNLIDNITPKGSDKKEVWENKIGGMLFIFMRVTADNKGSLLVKPPYEEILEFKKKIGEVK